MVHVVWYLNGGPSHVTQTFEYGMPTPSGIQMNTVFGCLVFRWFLYVYPVANHRKNLPKVRDSGNKKPLS